MVFKEIEPSLWIPEKEGDSITGTFVNADSNVGPNNSTMYHLEVEGKPVGIWGCTILDQRMVAVKPGDKLRITYKGLGEKVGGKNPAKIFKVEVDVEESVED